MALGLACPSPAQASGAFLTDDPGVAQAGVVQVESWLRAGPKGWEHWVVPAWLGPADTELSLALGVSRVGQEALLADYAVQAKRTLWTGAHGAGVGLAGGASLRASGRPVGGVPGTAYAYVPIAWSPGDGPVQGVLQPGLSLDALGPSWRLLPNYAAQLNYAPWPAWAFTLEANGSLDEAPYLQAGLSWWRRPDLERWDLSALRDPQGAWQLCVAWCAFGWGQRPPFGESTGKP